MGTGGGLIEFGKKVIICKRVKQIETATLESICSKVTISRRKRFCMGIYRPPNFDNIDTFLKEMCDPLSKAGLTYKNFIIMGGSNIDINTAGIAVDKLDEFCNIFDVTKLIKTETCCTKNHKLTIDLFLQIDLCLFKKLEPLKLELVIFHKLISTFF